MSELMIAVAFAIALPALATEPDKAIEIIHKQGRFTFSDGSSFYTFEKSGAFESGPLGQSGRTIKGKWKSDGDDVFVIEGIWGWLNGGSEQDDRRRLTLSVQGPFEKRGKMYKCYAVIEELVKLPR